jgi:hypothetical protein
MYLEEVTYNKRLFRGPSTTEAARVSAERGDIHRYKKSIIR